MDNSVTDNLYIHSTNLKIVQGYIDYDIRDRKIDLGWPHPRILQALAYLREIQLFMWQLDKEGKLIPHRHAEYSLYTPPNVNSRTDLLFINDNHFDRLQLRLNANDGIDKRDDLSKIILLNENNLAPASQNPQVKPLPRNQENDETKEIRHVVLRRAKVHLKEGEVCHHVHDWSPTLLFLKTRPQKMVEAEWQKLRKQFEDKTAQAKNIVVQTTNVLKEAATHSVTKIIEHSSKCSIF